MNTVEWLRSSLRPYTGKLLYEHSGRLLTPIASFRTHRSLFSIYLDRKKNEYLVHEGEHWEDGERPLLGYYHGYLSWEDLLTEIAKRYDEIRRS